MREQQQTHQHPRHVRTHSGPSFNLQSQQGQAHRNRACDLCQTLTSSFTHLLVETNSFTHLLVCVCVCVCVCFAEMLVELQPGPQEARFSGGLTAIRLLRLFWLARYWDGLKQVLLILGHVYPH